MGSSTVSSWTFSSPLADKSARRRGPIVGSPPWKRTELLLLALSGLAIAAVGALLPASWAATAETTTALRAE
jgi:putative ABC transport system permease protein